MVEKPEKEIKRDSSAKETQNRPESFLAEDLEWVPARENVAANSAQATPASSSLLEEKQPETASASVDSGRKQEPIPPIPDSLQEEEKVPSPFLEVPIKVSAILGKTKIEVRELLQLKPGSVLPLSRKLGEAVDVLVNDRLVARGEVVFTQEKLGITMTEIVYEEK